MPEKYELSDGAVLVADLMPQSRSVSVGFWVNVGSRDELQQQRGFSHFTEHMLFKGTRKRSCFDIARQVDTMGGEINGSTGKEATDYYINIASPHLQNALELLIDIFFQSSFGRDEFEKERLVILDEIELIRDDPEELVSDLFSAMLWGEHPLGHPVIGEKETIGAMRIKALKEFYKLSYIPAHLVVSVAGGFESAELIGMVDTLLRTVDRTRGSGYPIRERKKPVPKVGRVCHHRELEQVYFNCGGEGCSYRDEERYALALFNIIAGSSYSSRLFQRIREREGLCYSIGSSIVSYCDGGEFSIGFSTSLKNLPRVLEAVNRELKLLKQGDISVEELENAKARFKGNYILSQESNEWKMARMAMHEIIFGRIVPYEETIDKIERVSLDDLNRLASRLLQGALFSSACLGPEGTERRFHDWQFCF